MSGTSGGERRGTARSGRVRRAPSCVRDVVARGFLALLVAFLAGAPAPVAAWTDASVHSVKADVRVDAAGGARVALRVGVRVHAGWLEGLELAGLDPALVLDPAAPPVVMGETGAVFTPTATLRPDADGTTRIQLAFPRRGAPRRGAYEVALSYTTSLAHRATEASGDGHSVRVRWTLPPWQTGLDGVELALDVPGRATAIDGSGDVDAQRAQHDVSFTEGRTRLRWRRPHLPRSTTWTVAAEVPASALAASLREQSRRPDRASRRAPQSTWPTLLGAALGVLFATGLTARARTAALGPLGLLPRPLVALPRRARGLVVVALVAATPVVALAHPALAVLPLMGVVALLLVAGAGASPSAPRPPVALRAATGADLRAAARASRRARWLVADAFLDATTVPGVVVLLLGAAAVACLTTLAPPLAAPIVPLAGLLAGAPLFVLTRRTRPRSGAEALRGLARAARTLRVAEDAPYALSLRVPSDDGAVVAPRLGVVLPGVPDGLASLAFVHAERAVGPVVHTERVLVALVRRESDAHRALAPVVDALALSRTSDPHEIAWVLPTSAIDEASRALALAHARAESLLDADALHDDAAIASLLFADDVREDSRPSPCRSSDRALAG
jgi:hypothetical protein